MNAPVRSPLIEAPLQFRMRSGGRNANRAMVTCPKCGAPGFIRDSDRMSEQVTQLRCHCTNTGCGHTFRMDLVFVHTLVIGNLPQPDDLPVCPRDQVPHVLPPARDGPDPDQPSMFDPPG